MEKDNSSDEEFQEEENILDMSKEDLLQFYENYEEMKKNYISSAFLTKYERTKVISERSQQIANGGISYLKNPEAYNSIYEIAFEELKQKKIPFIIRRPVANGYEYWKLEDLDY